MLTHYYFFFLTHYYWPKSILYSDFLSFYRIWFFCPSILRYQVLFRCHVSVGSSWLWASLVVQLVKNQPAMQETWDRSLGWEIPWRRESLPTPVFRPGEFHGLYSSWGHKESDTTEWLSLGYGSFSDLPCSWWPCQFWGVLFTFL